MKNIIFAPPIVFAIFIAIFALSIILMSRYSKKGAIKDGRSLDAYACGQRNFENYITPSYTSFFRFAFIFTVMHVLVLVAATAPKDVTLLPIIYIVAGGLTLFIVFRR